jgi:cyanate lyase
VELHGMPHAANQTFPDVKPDAETLERLTEVLGISPIKLANAFGENYVVHRGESWTWPPKDPVLYRLYEVLVVYGVSVWKLL